VYVRINIIRKVEWKGKRRKGKGKGKKKGTGKENVNLADIFYTRRVIANFVPNCVAMATGIDRGKCDWQHSMAHP